MPERTTLPTLSMKGREDMNDNSLSLWSVFQNFRTTKVFPIGIL